jgi:enoyl-[acyl-carrier protein] reductase III
MAEGPELATQSVTGDFQGKIVLVTGSGRGIGRTIAVYFAERGADVVVNFFRNRNTAEDTVAEIEKFGGRVMLVKADVGDLADVNRLFDELDGPRFDILVHACIGLQPQRHNRNPGAGLTMNINARALLRHSAGR